MTNIVRNVCLSSGYDMPLIGFGTYKIQGKELIYEVVDESLNVGFRSIDTAVVYRNEEDIGYALKNLLPKYNLQRSDIFITTKLPPSVNGDPKGIEQCVQKSLKAFNTTYIDLYLIHWPGATRIPETSTNNLSLRAKTWKLLQNCKDILPAVNQVELHPHYRQEELIKYCNEKGIHIQAYSSLGTSGNINLLRNPIVLKIASQLNVSSARLLLNWALQQGIGVIPKAVNKEHIKDNIQLDFLIDEESMNILFSLPQVKYAWDPSNVY
ncbi:uncharacterized protein LOC107995223 isoform X2 [Apis cerana]|uniref:uncharacterized protein LOC107995223 isoform X2 n=1 Tax=Apis cerana TaxID=7461 RepID=UPI0007E2BDBA|nr:uncharacterized protein LOC107995223 isoform X2 [Apis cerana]